MSTSWGNLKIENEKDEDYVNHVKKVAVSAMALSRNDLFNGKWTQVNDECPACHFVGIALCPSEPIRQETFQQKQVAKGPARSKKLKAKRKNVALMTVNTSVRSVNNKRNESDRRNFTKEEEEEEEEEEEQEEREENRSNDDAKKEENLESIKKEPTFSESLNEDEFLSELMRECSVWDAAFPFSSKASLLKKHRSVLKKLAGSIIVPEGTVGAGKTTFCVNLHREFKKHGYPSKVLKEYVNDKVLEWFLEDEVANAFGFQLIMLFKRLETYKLALKLKKRGYTVIVDRSLHGDMAFELMHFKRGSISKQQHSIYLNHIKENSELLDVPDFCILLGVEIATARTNIERRGRPGELEVYTPTYLSNLKDSYEFCLKNFKVPVLRVEYDRDLRRDFPFPPLGVVSPRNKDYFDTKFMYFDTKFMYCILEDLICSSSKRTETVSPLP